jgi:hypothetical protein
VDIFKKLKTPVQVQDYLDTLKINFEPDGDTHYSPRTVYEKQEAHCIEAALFATAALWAHGHTPLLLDLRAARGDYDHVVALYRKNGYWGALSKSNHAVIRYRDPVYKTVRELAASYFHEWFPEKTGVRTLRSYSTPLDMRRFGREWITTDDDLFWVDDELNAQPHYPIAPLQNMRNARRADPIEIKAGSILEYPPT